MLCAGYFIHTCALPIIRSAAEPEKNIRNVFLGYFLVFISYAVVGTMGYIGFIGIKFEHYFLNKPSTANEIDQNCLNMFPYTNVPAFVLRLLVLGLLMTSYPLVAHFLRSVLMNLFFRNTEISKRIFFVTTFFLNFVPFLFAILYPNVGTILTYIGSLAGFLIIYCAPVLVHLKKLKTEITNPLLARAIHTNEFETKNNFDNLDISATSSRGPQSPTIKIKD